MLTECKKAIIGRTMAGEPVYDYNLLIIELERVYGWDAYEAADWLGFNFVGAAAAPIILLREED